MDDTIGWMRAIGPGSVASLLKIALDCAYVVMMIAAGLTLVGLCATLLALPFLPKTLDVGALSFGGRPVDGAHLMQRWPLIVAVMAAVCAYLAVMLVIINRLRRVFSTLIVGDPFQPENVNRLRTVGLALVALEGTGVLIRLSARALAPEVVSGSVYSISLSGWFAILAVFVLAEVFREGARLRRDAELTI